MEKMKKFSFFFKIFGPSNSILQKKSLKLNFCYYMINVYYDDIWGAISN